MKGHRHAIRRPAGVVAITPCERVLNRIAEAVGRAAGGVLVERARNTGRRPGWRGRRGYGFLSRRRESTDQKDADTKNSNKGAGGGQSPVVIEIVESPQCLRFEIGSIHVEFRNGAVAPAWRRVATRHPRAAEQPHHNAKGIRSPIPLILSCENSRVEGRSQEENDQRGPLGLSRNLKGRQPASPGGQKTAGNENWTEKEVVEAQVWYDRGANHVRMLSWFEGGEA